MSRRNWFIFSSLKGVKLRASSTLCSSVSTPELTVAWPGLYCPVETLTLKCSNLRFSADRSAKKHLVPLCWTALLRFRDDRPLLQPY
jgi:hypothetical protein